MVSNVGDVKEHIAPRGKKTKPITYSMISLVTETGIPGGPDKGQRARAIRVYFGCSEMFLLFPRTPF